MKYLACIIFLFSLEIRAQGESSSRHTWMFADGNLISNWSFEEYSSELCSEGATSDGSDPGRFAYDCRRKSAGQQGEPAPYSGNYVLKVTTSNSTGFKTGPFSEPIEIAGGASYKLSMRVFSVRGGAANPINYPIVNFYDAFGTVVDQTPGEYYESSLPVESQWDKYEWTFAAPAGATQMRLFIVNMQASQSNQGKNFYFDDIKLSRADQEEFTPYGSRSYGDAFSRAEQSIAFDGEESVVRERAYDSKRKVKKEFLPISVLEDRQKSNDFIVSDIALDGSLKADYSNLQSAYLGIKAIIQSLPAASVPSEVTMYVIVGHEYDLAPILEQELDLTAIPAVQGGLVDLEIDGVVKGTSMYNALVAGAKPFIASHFSSRYQSQTTFEDDAKIQYPGENNVKTEYAYPDDGANTFTTVALPGEGYGFSDSPSHLASSGFALLETSHIPASPAYNPDNETGDPVVAEFPYTWKADRQGNFAVQIFDEAGNLKTSAFNKVPNPSSESEWAKTEYSYNSFNQLESVASPEGMVTQSSYDGLNRLVTYNDPDRGLRNYLYDKNGNLRFTKTPRSDAEGNVTFFKYDHANRMIGTGQVPKANFTQANADNPLYPSNDNIGRGAVFDELQAGEWEQNLSVSFASLGIDLQALKNGRGQVVMDFNKNSESTVPGMGPADKLVADFFSYDEKGRISEKYVYIGMAPAGRKLHKIKYAYDDLDRVLTKTVYKDQTESVIAVQNTYVYNNKGQVVSILDKDGNVMMASEYNFRDELVHSDLFNEVGVSYGHDIQGKLTSLSAQRRSGTDTHLYSEYLGYEGKPDNRMVDDIPASMARYDGKVSSVLRQYSDQAPDNVEWDQFDYDVTGYLKSQPKKFPAAPASTLPDGSLDMVNLDFSGGSVETQGYVYDADFRLTSHTKNFVNYGYEYVDGTHQLKKITPDIAPGRSTSQANAFVYDENGNLEDDNSLGKVTHYNYEEMPVRMNRGGKTMHFLYNPEGYRAATVLENGSGTLEKTKAYVYENGLNLIKEIESSNGSTVVKNKFQGIDGIIGHSVESSGAKVLSLKNYLGSTVANLTVSSTQVDFEKGYDPYGSIDRRVTSQNRDLEASESFTGKEFDEELGAFYFGTRWYDPGLGVWLSPDPAHQYSNPYSYGAGDPVNGIDKDGEVFWFVIGGVATFVGTYTFFSTLSDLSKSNAKGTTHYSQGQMLGRAALLGVAAGGASVLGGVLGGAGAAGTALAIIAGAGAGGASNAYVQNATTGKVNSMQVSNAAAASAMAGTVGAMLPLLGAETYFGQLGLLSLGIGVEGLGIGLEKSFNGSGNGTSNQPANGTPSLGGQHSGAPAPEPGEPDGGTKAGDAASTANPSSNSEPANASGKASNSDANGSNNGSKNSADGIIISDTQSSNSTNNASGKTGLKGGTNSGDGHGKATQLILGTGGAFPRGEAEH